MSGCTIPHITTAVGFIFLLSRSGSFVWPSNASVGTFTLDVHARVRASAGRRDRLQAFLQRHPPPGVDVGVVLTPAVQTATVLPADIDALVNSDETDHDCRPAQTRGTRLWLEERRWLW